jgi:PAS domain S-box-containing protein
LTHHTPIDPVNLKIDPTRSADELGRENIALSLRAENLRGILESAMDAILTVDDTHRIVFLNAAAEAVFGCSREQAIGAHIEQFIPERFRAGHAAHMHDFGATGVTSRRMGVGRVVTALRSTGEEFPIAASISKTTEAGRVYYTVIVRDVTEQVNKEQALERSNTDLQQFAYIASHDLKTPLRAIAGFVDLLQSQYGPQLDERANDLIRRATDGTRRLERLIDDLLAYSRLHDAPRANALVNCRTAFDESIRLLATAIQESGAIITADELPTINVNSAQLIQLLQNLIGNAIKYRGTEPPQIHVSAKRQHIEWQFAVTDNGIGFDPEHSQRIFEIFRRLHTQRAYPGTGIGLAICQRIVHRHGGKIWVESQVGKGSTFYFTIPDSNKESRNE